MAEDRLDLPARKLHLKDFKNLRLHGMNFWHENENLKFQVNVVWVQGVITNIANNRQKVVLTENGTSVVIVGCESIPGGNEWLQKGDYVMVIGDLEYDDQQKDGPTIKAIKMASLSKNEIHKLTWEYEVSEMKKIIIEIKS